MEWSFDGPNGAVTVRQEGERAICQAIRGPDGRGLYKAWLQGKKGRFLLGTLIPEGGALRLRRSVPVAQIERQGAWPPVGAEIVMAYPFPDNRPPEGWQWEDCPARLLGDSLLAQSASHLKRALTRKDEQGFFLAIPFDTKAPFPLCPLFCLSWPERLNGAWYILFRFSRKGWPEFPHISGAVGEAMGEA